MAWLTTAELRVWLGLLGTFAGLEQALDHQLQRDVGISHGSYGILAALSEAGDGIRHMSELAGIAGYSQSRLSHAVTRLEREGLVRRAECPHDKRGIHASLTEEGHRLIERAAPGHVATVRTLVFDRLTPEQLAALDGVLTTLRASLVEAGIGSLPTLPETAEAG